jgi:hypothetical protein
MTRRNSVLISCLLMVLTAGFIAAQPGPFNARGPKGIYVRLELDVAANQAETAAYPDSLPSYPNQAVDEVLVAYFTTLMDNPATSGLAVETPWSFLNPNDPGPDPFHPAANAYLWNWLDDVFIAVDQWNRTHHDLPPKTIQLLPSAGFNSPAWVLSDIDNSVCGGNKNCTGAGSCDGLFMLPEPAVSPKCGYTTIFFKTESNPAEQIPLPLPWNSVYKRDWWAFLAALNQRIQQEPSNSAFVSISMAGPTASSTEMSLPNASATDQGPYTCPVGANQYLSLMESLTGPPGNRSPVCPLTNPGFEVPTAWNLLFQNYYGPNPNYQNSDLPFIEEWDATIDAYGQIFSGVTLTLTPNDDPLPTFPVAASSPLLIPVPGFESDCGNDPQKNLSPDLGDAMSCAAITQILVHFTNSTVGGNNGKSTQVNGLNADDTSIDMGNNGVKWLTATTASGRTLLPGTPFRMSRMLGGAQFAHSFSGPIAQIEQVGCPHHSGDCTGPAGSPFTPAEGLQNVLSISFFPGTAVGPDFCPFTDPSTYGCSSSVDFANWIYSNAPLNYLQVYDADILYASGLGNCSVGDITGNPASPGNPAMPPDVSACQVVTSDTQTTQTELNLASQKLLSITEQAQ